MKKLSFLILLFAILCTLCSCHRADPGHTTDDISTAAEISTEPTTEYIPKPLEQGTYLETYEDPVLEKSMAYHLYIPKNATEHMPLVIFLHGLGAVGSPALNEENPVIVSSRFIYGEEFPYLILAPTSRYSSWTSQDMPERVKSLIDYVVSEYNIDQSKIILTGHSMGSSGVFRLIKDYGDYFSAAISVSDPYAANIHLEACVDVPVWAFASNLESPYNERVRRAVEGLKELGADAIYTELYDVKHGDTAEFAFVWDVYEWALSK